MEYEIVTVGEKKVCGVSVKTENAGGKAVRDIEEIWRGFFARNMQEMITGRADDMYIGLYTEYEGDESKPYTYVAGCEASGGALVEKTIRAGKYAKYTARSGEEIGAVWNAVWNAAYRRKFESDFEEYTFDGDPAQPREINIYIGIEEERKSGTGDGHK
ncbi:MAG TPA: hypothetical protein DEB31_00850 [Clostridiales bacterium]|nr:hypothetical protein [Clostridiales bacterium]